MQGQNNCKLDRVMFQKLNWMTRRTLFGPCRMVNAELCQVKLFCLELVDPTFLAADSSSACRHVPVLVSGLVS